MSEASKKFDKVTKFISEFESLLEKFPNTVESVTVSSDLINEIKYHYARKYEDTGYYTKSTVLYIHGVEIKSDPKKEIQRLLRKKTNIEKEIEELEKLV